ncbi:MULTISPECIES: type I restriction-modification system endonuclease [unclassified Endozoicomonas]|uniref:type I restriction-modification system endonuclease n=1 Tax=unclassified Endozoicomonas TaxID=2644528 RepID=UPI00214948BC|nr:MULTISPECIES: type I restriction-modification system endonuclease [unclassified Endozoicomonas]WOG26265.1 type I restriction-modification system endonuclease [Endozoicomonas sp. 8E]
MAAKPGAQPSNFQFLAEHDSLFLELATAAERSFSSDPNTTLIKLRQLGEALAQHIASLCGITSEEPLSQNDLLYRLNRELSLDPKVREMFHILRKEGNKATHQFQTSHREAISGLRVARELAIWFHRSLTKNARFNPGPFLPPPDPSRQLRELHEQIEKLKADLSAANVELESSQQYKELDLKEKEEYKALAFEMDKEARQLQEQVKQHDQALEDLRKSYEAKLAEADARVKALTEKEQADERQTIAFQTATAGQQVNLDEEMTRILIDNMLTEAGWKTDTQELTWQKGARPEHNQFKAIAEWPTVKENGKRGWADYVLFHGLMPIAVVEAKRENVNVSGKIPQAEDYSRGLQIEPPLKAASELAGRSEPWSDGMGGYYIVPFVYSCNGRPYVPQIKEQSGIWFRDVRMPSNIKRALPQFHTPQGLKDLLDRSREAAEKALQNESYDYLNLRDYQQKAIEAVENTLSKDIRTALLAMATGTGKTRTVLGLMYRFLKTERFKRILFLVDRNALGKQANDTFMEAKLEQNQSLTQIYDVLAMKNVQVEPETRVQTATVQAMVQRIFASDNPPSIDQYDCIIIDEAHRGYTLDQEMTEGEMTTRDAAQYLSSYRRVLDYFDAVKIGLTATPAAHTKDIFGSPVYTYSYREAVADDWLIDYEPPIRYITKLAQQGIRFDESETVSVINTRTGEVEQENLKDELNFEIEAFNRRVINQSFNRVICDELVKELDPLGEEKTMIFCATDRHADMVKRLLDEAFERELGSTYNEAAVKKITGESNNPPELIKQFKNERYPNIAITVDLLTTGIDVPKICNLVFMRRVKSRILFEQMIGRATRRCDEIGKTVFRIYDPVDIFAAFDRENKNANSMKPLVKDPNITIEQLVEELTDPARLEQSLNISGDTEQETQADSNLSQLSQKLMRVLRKAEHKSDYNQPLKEKLQQLEELWGVEPKKLHTHLHRLGPKKAAEFIHQHAGLINQINDVKALTGSDYRPVISEHQDEVRERVQSYGIRQRPEDYLDSFNDFIKHQLNESAALSVVVNRPKDLTREQLKEVKMLLDAAGYNEAGLQAAVREQSHRDIAASIIGHIRRAALGEALMPFEQRVALAMDRIYTSHKWNTNQRKWLERLAKQLVFEVVVDQQFINERFAQQGGVKQFNKVLDDQLDNVLDLLGESLWEPAQAANG